jgi:acyl-CoA thioester hydrolase
MGHVNHAVYFTYFEQCRLTCWLELTGSAHPHTPVIIARAECDYRSQALFGDELEVTIVVGEVRRSSFALRYRIERTKDPRLVAEGTTVMVSYDYEAGRSVPLPETTRALLNRFR